MHHRQRITILTKSLTLDARGLPEFRALPICGTSGPAGGAWTKGDR